MTRYRTIWQAADKHEFEVLDEGSPFRVEARPMVVSFYFGTTVALFHRSQFTYGVWTSSNICDFITAWRVCQLVPRIETLSDKSGYNSTLCGLVIALGGDNHAERQKARAADLGMSESEYVAELERVRHLWPTVNEICKMWDDSSDEERHKVLSRLRKGRDNGLVWTAELESRIELAELQIRTMEDQKEYEDRLIAAGLQPEVSLKQLLVDIGVSNLAYTSFDDFAPSHFEWEDLDRSIMKELIGPYGFSSSVLLITTVKQPDDKSAHYAAGGNGVAVVWSDFGDRHPPRVTLADQAMELVSVSWDRVTERFLLTIRPVGASEFDKRDHQMSVPDLREQLGIEMGLMCELPVGESVPEHNATKGGMRSGLMRRFFP